MSLDAVSYQFQALGEDERTVTIPFVGVSRLMAEGDRIRRRGRPHRGHGDLAAWPGSVAGHVQRDLHHRLRRQRPVHESHGRVQPGHGPNRPEDPPGGPAHANRSNPRPSVGFGCRVSQPGPGHVVRPDLGTGGRWRLVVSRMEVVDFGPLPSMAVPHFKLRL